MKKITMRLSKKKAGAVWQCPKLQAKWYPCIHAIMQSCLNATTDLL